MAKTVDWITVAASIAMAGALFLFPFLRQEPVLAKADFESAVVSGEIRRVDVLQDGTAMVAAANGNTYRTAAYRNDAWYDWLTDNGVAVGEETGSRAMLPMSAGILMFSGAVMRATGRNKLKSLEKSGEMRALDAPPPIRLSDVAGNNEARSAMLEVCDFLRRPDMYVRTGARPPSGILLYGPPGTGKTTLARALAGEAGVPFVACSGSDFIQMYAGVGAARVRELFANARKSERCVIFIDEIDAFGRRGADVGASGERDQTLNALLTEMSGFHARPGVLVVAATNRLEMLDEALTRPGRFDRLIYVGNPDKSARAAILAVHSRGKPLDADVDIAHWAGKTIGFSGARLERLLNEAAIRAARKSSESITAREMEEAYLAVVTGTNAANGDAEDQDARGGESLRIAAIHEAGHALVTRFAVPNQKIERVSLLRSSAMGGFMLSLPQEDAFPTRRTLDGTLMSILGGRAAEQLVFGVENVSTGASDDLSKATELAWEMVSRYGMDEEFGPVALSVFPSGNGSFMRFAQDRCRVILSRALSCAQSLLDEHRPALIALADALVERETLTGREVDEITAVTKRP